MEKMPDLLKIADVVQLTGLHERTLRSMVSDGRLPVVRLAGVRRIRVPVEAVRRLLGQQPARQRRQRVVLRQNPLRPASG